MWGRRKGGKDSIIGLREGSRKRESKINNEKYSSRFILGK